MFFLCVQKENKEKGKILRDSKSVFPDQSKQIKVWKHPSRGNVKVTHTETERPKYNPISTFIANP